MCRPSPVPPSRFRSYQAVITAGADAFQVLTMSVPTTNGVVRWRACYVPIPGDGSNTIQHPGPLLTLKREGALTWNKYALPDHDDGDVLQLESGPAELTEITGVYSAGPPVLLSVSLQFDETPPGGA